MNILLVWIGGYQPMYEWRTMCIRRLKEVYPDANYTVITRMKRFFDMKIVKPENYDVGVNPDSFKSYTDYARLKWLSENENTLYIDTDTWCIKPYEFTDEMGSAFFEAIWSGKECDKIKEVFDMNKGEKLLFSLGSELDERGVDLNEYFEHKPERRRQYINRFD